LGGSANHGDSLRSPRLSTLIKVKPENSAVCVPPTGLVQPHGKRSKLWARLDWGARDALAVARPQRGDGRENRAKTGTAKTGTRENRDRPEWR
jgi:hypothetical protein